MPGARLPARSPTCDGSSRSRTTPAGPDRSGRGWGRRFPRAARRVLSRSPADATGTPRAASAGVDERDFRLPFPSEDEGDLVDEPPEGISDDPIVATEEGVPWEPPLERVEGDDLDPADELEADETIQAVHAVPRDDRLRADVVEAL